MHITTLQKIYEAVVYSQIFAREENLFSSGVTNKKKNKRKHSTSFAVVYFNAFLSKLQFVDLICGTIAFFAFNSVK